MRKIILLLLSILFSSLSFFLLCRNIHSPAAAACSPDKTVTAQKESVIFPCRIGDTDLWAERVLLYEGGFLEDGSNKEVVDILALEIINKGDQIVRAAAVELKNDTEHFEFCGTYLLPGKSVIILEKNMKRTMDFNFSTCRGISQNGVSNWKDAQYFLMNLPDPLTLEITNPTDSFFDRVIICYKNYLPESDIYAGGITHRAVVGPMAPGQKITISPKHFAPDYSRIIGFLAVKNRCT